MVPNMEVIAVMAVDEVGVRTVAQKEAARAPKPISESKLAGTKVNELKAEAVQVRVDREAGTQEEKEDRSEENESKKEKTKLSQEITGKKGRIGGQ